MRSKYEKAGESAKQRILAAPAASDNDQKGAAKNCDVHTSTAYEWVNNYNKEINIESKNRDGKKYGKVTDLMVNDTLYMITDDATISLKGIDKRVSKKHEINPPPSTATVDNHLNGKSVTVEKVLKKPENANIPPINLNIVRLRGRSWPPWVLLNRLFTMMCLI